MHVTGFSHPRVNYGNIFRNASYDASYFYNLVNALLEVRNMK
jgi:hypothetical protein